MKRKSLPLVLAAPDLPGRITISAAEVRELKRVLDGPISEGTVDQLGFGVLFDSIAQTLFPWCSTLTTRVKYLLWSPAVVQLAVQLHIHRIMGDTPRDRLNESQLQALTELLNGPRARDLGATITKIESALAVALYFKYGEARTGLGIFGSRNLNYRLRNGTFSTPKLIGGRGLLSTAARYPNAIYWNSLSELDLYGDGIDSKKKAIQLLIQGKSPWSTEWAEQIDLILETEIRPIWERLGPHVGHPGEVCQGKWLNDFNGFQLEDDARSFLLSRFKDSTPFWGLVLERQWKSALQNDAKTYAILESMLRDRTAKNRCRAASLAIYVCTPIREIYQDLVTGKTESSCKVYNWGKIKSRLGRLKKLIKALDEIAYARNAPLLNFLESFTAAQLETSQTITSKPCKKSIELLIKREKSVLRARGKVQKRLLNYRDQPGPDGYQSREALSKRKDQGTQDAEISEITFRLGSAINFFNDLRKVST